MRTVKSIVGGALLVAVLVGCRQDMHDQPKAEPLEASTFFADGRASRLPVEGTVARGHLREDDHFYRGLDAAGMAATTLPMELTVELLERGRNRYDIFCAPCHSRLGDGNGMIVRRGFKQPESFHAARLRDSPVGYYFSVMTNGFGEMSDYAAQVRPADRWAIAAYIKALQLSQHVPLTDLPPELRARAEAGLAGGAAALEEAHSE